MTEAVDAGIFEAWLASTDDGAIAIDASGRVVLHNPAASRVTGLAPGDGRHQAWREVLHLEPAIADMLWEVRDTGQSTRAVADVLCAQGNVRPAEISARPWTDAGGRVGVLILIRDPAVLCRHRTGPGGRPGYGSLVGADPAMEALYDLIEAVAPSDAPLLIEGEPGVGKDLVAQLIHARSHRSERPLVAVDCAALSPAMLGVELFGQVRGAGGVAGGALGRMELAHSGTLLLDRVSDVSPGMQDQLLRMLESGEVERGGDPTPRRIDVRIIASSHRPLTAEVRQGRFRQELLYRLRVVHLQVPPLRERRGDIPLLADHFLARHGPPGTALSSAALAVLQAGDWPGNVRQLEGAIRHALACRSPGAASAAVGPELLPHDLRLSDRRRASLQVVAPMTEDRRTLLLRALSSHGGNRTAAARALGIGRATFYRWWREAGLGGLAG